LSETESRQDLEEVDPSYGVEGLEMSSLRNKDGVFEACSSLMRFWTWRKLSWMLLFLTKALWHLETISGSSGERRLASSLEKIFERLWMRLIGL
jgi:hypothetical protein